MLGVQRSENHQDGRITEVRPFKLSSNGDVHIYSQAPRRFSATDRRVRTLLASMPPSLQSGERISRLGTKRLRHSRHKPDLCVSRDHPRKLSRTARTISASTAPARLTSAPPGNSMFIVNGGSAVSVTFWPS